MYDAIRAILVVGTTVTCCSARVIQNAGMFRTLTDTLRSVAMMGFIGVLAAAFTLELGSLEKFTMKLIFFLLPVIALGQDFVPYQAAYHETRNLYSSDGSFVRRWESVGNITRDIRGGEYSKKQNYQDGVQVGEPHGEFKDAVTGTTYILKFTSKQALVVSTSPLPFKHKSLTPSAAKPLRTEVVNGVLCSVYPVTDSSKQQTGSIWVSPENELVVKWEFSTLRTDGKFNGMVERGTVELTDIKIGSASDQLQLPADFTNR